jgi:hypothetical protein
MKPFYIAAGFAIIAVFGYLIGPDVVRYIKISTM